MFAKAVASGHCQMCWQWELRTAPWQLQAVLRNTMVTFNSTTQSMAYRVQVYTVTRFLMFRGDQNSCLTVRCKRS
jgi:hypothetical protein